MDPEWLTALGRKELYDQLTDRSDAAAARALAWRRRSVAGMKARFDPAKLSDEARTSYDIWALELARAEETHRWRGHRYLSVREFDRAGQSQTPANAMRLEAGLTPPRKQSVGTGNNRQIVVPLPAKKSSTTSPGARAWRRRYSMSPTGLGKSKSFSPPNLVINATVARSVEYQPRLVTMALVPFR
mgnify:CR=1 FL=1